MINGRGLRPDPHLVINYAPRVRDSRVVFPRKSVIPCARRPEGVAAHVDHVGRARTPDSESGQRRQCSTQGVACTEPRLAQRLIEGLTEPKRVVLPHCSHIYSAEHNPQMHSRGHG